MKKIIILIMFLLILQQTYSINYAEFSFVDKDNYPVTSTFVRGYKCSDNQCVNIQGTLFDDTLSSNNYVPFSKIIVPFPTTVQSNYYILYAYNENYLTKYIGPLNALGYTDQNHPGTSHNFNFL